MENTLYSLGLEDMIPVFIENNIDEEAVLLLGDGELKELIPKIGPRLKFKKYIQSLKQNQQLDLPVLDGNISPTPTTTTSSVSEIADEDTPIAAAKYTEYECAKQILEVQSTAPATDDSNIGSIDGRALLKDGQSSGGLLKEGSRRKLSQLLIHHTLENRPSGKIETEEFYRLASGIVGIFNKESAVVYYSAYLAGTGERRKKNASGKLYESYITRRRKLRLSGQLPGTSRATSNRSTSISTPSATSEDDVDPSTDDNDENLTWLNNNVDPWKTVEKKWNDTSDYRLKHIYDDGGGNISKYFNTYPALRQPQGYTLLQNDFNQMYPGKENNLFSMLSLKQEDILEYAKGKAQHSRNKTLKTDILNLIGRIREDDTETVKNVCLMLLAYVINLSPARKRKGRAALKFSRAEICDGYIKQVSSEAEVTNCIIEKREQSMKQKRTLQPFVIFVGNSITEVKASYVVVNETAYHFEKLITAIDSVFKIFQSTGACYPEECEDLWLFIQLGFYNIRTKFDRQTQVVNTLLTDLGLIND